MIQHKKDLFDQIHTPMRKAIRFGEGILQTGILAKGIWDVGSKIVQGARALAPAATALL